MPKRKERPAPIKGKKYERYFKGNTFVLSVIEQDGQVKYKLGDEVFDSPSGAAKSLNGGKEVNGWTFWKIDK